MLHFQFFFHCKTFSLADSEESLNEKETEEGPGNMSEDPDEIEKETTAKPEMTSSLQSQNFSDLGGRFRGL